MVLLECNYPRCHQHSWMKRRRFVAMQLRFLLPVADGGVRVYTN